MLLVFGGGICTLGIELTASRLLAPYFGTSQLIWANVIGLTLLYLTAGYTIGGRWADKRPELGLLCTIIAVAGVFSAIIPLLSHPILKWSLSAFESFSVGVFVGSLLGVLALFSIPITLLGMVSPFAIRLAIKSTDGAGKAAGNLYAISTLGSIIGTFLPVLLLIPLVGTAMTIYIFAGGLILIALPGLWVERRRAAMLATAALIGVIVIALFPIGQIKAADCARCELILEDDSAYNYIQIVERDNGAQGQMIGLVLNEGQAIHSIYFPRFAETGNPADLLTGGPWDFYNVAPYFYANRDPESITSMAMVGSAAGSVPKQFLAIYGSDSVVDGVEIDPRIAELGREYFAMQDTAFYAAKGETAQFPNFNTYITDGRVFFAGNDQKYDIIGMDAYKQPYIPFHLTTKEFFETVRDHLAPGGVAVVNAGRPGTDYRLANVLASTMSSVFPQVYMIDVPANSNTMLIGVPASVGDGVQNFMANLERIQDPTLRTVMQMALDTNSNKKPIRLWQPTDETRVFTDDKAPVEWVIDQIIVNVVNEGP
ncbi:MAG: fused MFS/spermidine synthase [Herpetosiphonaceae bacterium]|nr:fused MFS/spermidine synthase [Herpetosiphonaceae bacterium]